MRYVKESHIEAPPHVVFGFHESPEALRMLIPPWEHMRVAEASGSLRPGSKVVLGGRVCGVPVHWVAVHTEYDPPHLFADVQESGPFTKWSHRHQFLGDGHGGTILRDEVEYELPLGRLGRWLAGWFVERRLERMFDFRHQVTRRLIEEVKVPSPMPLNQVGKVQVLPLDDDELHRGAANLELLLDAARGAHMRPSIEESPMPSAPGGPQRTRPRGSLAHTGTSSNTPCE